MTSPAPEDGKPHEAARAPADERGTAARVPQHPAADSVTGEALAQLARQLFADSGVAPEWLQAPMSPRRPVPDTPPRPESEGA